MSSDDVVYFEIKTDMHMKCFKVLLYNLFNYLTLAFCVFCCLSFLLQWSPYCCEQMKIQV